MRISHDTLSPDLIHLLSAFSTTFASTAQSFLTQESVHAEPFSRVCELHTTLLYLSESPHPTALLQQLGGRDGADGDGNGDVKHAQELLGFMLNAEFMLWELYRGQGCSVLENPSLFHWVTVGREWERRERTTVWGVREKVLKIRVAFVRGILCEEGPKLAEFTPHDCASRGLDFPVDLAAFMPALHAQGIYDDYEEPAAAAAEPQPEPEEPEPSYSSLLENSTDESGYSSAASPPATPTPADQLTALLLKATTDPLPTPLTQHLLTHLSTNRSLLSAYPLDFLSVSTLAAYVSCNPVLARGIVVLLLEATSLARRAEVLGTLAGLPVALGMLDLVNRVLMEGGLLGAQEKRHLLHGYLNNAIRAAEEESGGKRVQTRIVQLIVLFVTALIRGEVVAPEEVFYEVQELGVRFAWVREARELWRGLCAVTEGEV